MIPYQIRSVQLINLVRDIKNGTLIPNAYFQRNLVWRDIHKKELIKTILLGYPFPLIFISQGGIDVEKMTATSCIVDGQQRCDAIESFIDGDYKVDGRFFSEFTEAEKTTFFKYEIPVCEIDILNTDTQVLDMFKRINRTSNSLTNIEKMASEFGATYFMLVARLLADQIEIKEDISEDDLTIDPNIPSDFIEWAKSIKIKYVNKLLTDERIFSKRDVSRKVNIQYTLNLMSTYIDGFYNRNDKIEDNLNTYADEFEIKDMLINNFELTSEVFLGLNLNDKSPWYNKANFFSIFIYISNLISKDIEINSKILKSKLENFDFSPEYKIAAKEGVNNLKERQLRDRLIRDQLNDLIS
ncbi:DUF262 domain-containing protein [Acinetobacter sp. ACZLY 512]|uniref:DUF262 domain-containing protein n=1 Tax=Acinetobacter sp. ACZLY 512 TaxID=2911206 RepID=UPI002026FE05|nr:DUF262 domain-containing protein [Acinetobacter sp. ACZLY 512]MCL9675043.1 DUF262 domain-containing protein [Acinetobacter sp. ACZLY 512]